VKIDVAPLRHRIKEIAATRVRYGYRRIHVLLRREGWLINHKRVCRIYREEGLSMRHRPPKRRRAAMMRRARTIATRANETWSMDFLADELPDGRRIRLLAIVDNFTRECLAREAGLGFKADRVVSALQRIVLRRGSPQRIRLDNGPDFVSKQLDQWAYWNHVKLDFSRPGKPTDNAFVESTTASARIPQRELVRFARRSSPACHALASRLQQKPSSQRATKFFAESVRREGVETGQSSREIHAIDGASSG